MQIVLKNEGFSLRLRYNEPAQDQVNLKSAALYWINEEKTVTAKFFFWFGSPPKMETDFLLWPWRQYSVTL